MVLPSPDEIPIKSEDISIFRHTQVKKMTPSKPRMIKDLEERAKVPLFLFLLPCGSLM